MKHLTISDICEGILASSLGLVGLAPACAFIALEFSMALGVGAYIAFNIVALTLVWRTILELD